MPTQRDTDRSGRRRGQRTAHGRNPVDDDRGQSEALAVVLLLGVAVVGIGFAVYLGFGALDAEKERTDVEQAEHSFSELDREASAVALGDADVREIDLGTTANDGQVRTDPDAGWIRVRILNDSTGTPDWEFNETLGAVVYENDGERVAYQGGGVFRSDGDRSVLVSRPEVHYRDGTLTVPVVAVRGEGGVDDRLQLTRGGPPERAFPDPAAGYSNRITSGKVELTVHSEYYEAWGEYFEASTNAYVTYDHDANEVNVVFLAVPRWGTLDDGIVATSGSGELLLLGTGAYVDSYDSSVGPYSTTRSANGTVKSVGDVRLSGDSEIAGDVRSGALVEVGTSAVIDGDVYWTEDLVVDGTVTGDNETIEGVPSIPPIDGFVDASVDRLRNENDNDRTDCVEGREIDPGGSCTELGPGSYYLENLHLEGEDLTVNTSDGDVTIAVEDWISLEKQGGTASNLTVVGDGVVRVFVASEDEREVSLTGSGKTPTNLHVGKSSSLYVEGHRSPRFRLYGPQDFRAAIAGSSSQNATFVGVIYAPAGRNGPGKVYVKQTNVYGQILTGNLTLGQYGQVHYDRNLRGVPLPQAPTVARLEFMHIAVHRVNVTDARIGGLSSSPPPETSRSTAIASAVAASDGRRAPTAARTAVVRSLAPHAAVVATDR